MMLCLLGLVFDVLSLLGFLWMGCVLVEVVCFVVWCCLFLVLCCYLILQGMLGLWVVVVVLVFGLMFCYCLALYCWLWVCIRCWLIVCVLGCCLGLRWWVLLCWLPCGVVWLLGGWGIWLFVGILHLFSYVITLFVGCLFDGLGLGGFVLFCLLFVVLFWLVVCYDLVGEWWGLGLVGLVGLDGLIGLGLGE